MSNVFGTKRIRCFSMGKFLNPHMTHIKLLDRFWAFERSSVKKMRLAKEKLAARTPKIMKKKRKKIV